MKKMKFIFGCFCDASRYFFQPCRWYIVRLEMRSAWRCLISMAVFETMIKKQAYCFKHCCA